jgi:hypothetical protein
MKETMHKEWNKIYTWIEINAPMIKESLNSGISSHDLLELDIINWYNIEKWKHFTQIRQVHKT